MARRFNPYTTRRTEPDMRQELENTLDGVYPEVAKKQRAVLRKMRRPLEDNVCPCVDAVTKEPDKDHFCPICHGEGYLWDEEFMDIYKVVIKSDVGNALLDSLQSPGNIGPPLVTFYTRYSSNVTKEDRVVQLVLNDDGSPVQPYRRRAIYHIGLPIDFRSDNGKLEYWKLDCYLDERKFLNGVE